MVTMVVRFRQQMSIPLGFEKYTVKIKSPLIMETMPNNLDHGHDHDDGPDCAFMLAIKDLRIFCTEYSPPRFYLRCFFFQNSFLHIRFRIEE